MRSDDIRITRLAVTMVRDDSLRAFLDHRRHMKDTLLYVGLTPGLISKIRISDLADSLTLRSLLAELSGKGLLASFLTQLLSLQWPDDIDELRKHIEPLGLDLDEDSYQIRPIGTHPKEEQQLGNELDRLLAKTDSTFPPMLKGAWTVYYSDSSDRYRQAVASCRALLTDVTKKLGGDEGERKQRVERILRSESRAKVVDAAISLINSLYATQSGQEHAKPDQPTALFALLETEHILYFLLTHKRARTHER